MFRDFDNRLEAALAQAHGYQQAGSADLVGSWNDAAATTLATESQDQDYEHRRIAATLKAL